MDLRLLPFNHHVAVRSIHVIYCWQNVWVHEPQAGMEFTRQWLASEGLEIYWPTFSRLSYPQLLLLDANNWGPVLQSVNSHDRLFSFMDKQRILELTFALRQRGPRLMELVQSSVSEALLNELRGTLLTPLAHVQEYNGQSLLEIISQAFFKIAAMIQQYGRKDLRGPLETLLRLFRDHPSVPNEYVQAVYDILVSQFGWSSPQPHWLWE